MNVRIFILLSLALGGFFPLKSFAGGGGGGGGCGPSNSCSGAPSLTLNTVYSYSNSSCGADADCINCFQSSNCTNICSGAPNHNEDCNSTIMGALCSVSGAFCGSPENTSWAQFCPATTGNYTFSVSNISCSGGGGSLQYGIYAAGVNCTNNTQSGLLDCTGGTTSSLSYTESLVAGNCYLIVFDGNAGAACTWDFQITGPPLAVTLTDYDLITRENAIEVTWATSMEDNTKNFHITRRYDDMHRVEGMSEDAAYNKMQVSEHSFDPAVVRAEGPRNYSYLDKNVHFPGVYHYDLFEEDGNGALHFLGTNQVYVNPPEQTVLAQVQMGTLPGTYVLTYQIAKEDRVKLTTWSIDGRNVKSFDLGIKEPGQYSQEVDLSWLPAGVYLYELNVGGQAFSGKLIK